MFAFECWLFVWTRNSPSDWFVVIFGCANEIAQANETQNDKSAEYILTRRRWQRRSMFDCRHQRVAPSGGAITLQQRHLLDVSSSVLKDFGLTPKGITSVKR